MASEFSTELRHAAAPQTEVLQPLLAHPVATHTAEGAGPTQSGQLRIVTKQLDRATSKATVLFTAQKEAA